MSSPGKTLKVDMALMSNLYAYPKDSKFTPDGYPHIDREGTDMAGMNTGNANRDQKIAKGKDFDGECFETYRKG